MAPKKPTLTSKALQALLTRIGSASSGTKSTLLQRFQRQLPRPYNFHPQSAQNGPQREPWSRKIRLMSIDMGIKNLAFCDAEISYPASTAKSKQSLEASMNVLRWKKLDLVEGTRARNGQSALVNTEENAGAAEEDTSQFSPSVLSKTAYKFITEEVLSVNPDIVLIEKQRWRSGGGSAVQQWTVRVNTLEAMLWAVLETVKRTRQCSVTEREARTTKDFEVRAVDPKRVGQYWLSQHAKALEEREEEALAYDMSALSKSAEEPDDLEDETDAKATKKPSRSKAEKSAKIAILRSWLAGDAMSTIPSTPSSMPHITFSIDPGAESTRQALMPKVKAIRRKKTSKTSKTSSMDVELVEDMPAAEIRKLDDITDCFLQAAAWVAWESNRGQLLGVCGGGKGKDVSTIDEERILKMIEETGGI